MRICKISIKRALVYGFATLKIVIILDLKDNIVYSEITFWICRMTIYTQRTLLSIIEKLSGSFPVLLVSGPRQVGKTTLLQHAQREKRHYVTLDDPIEKALAKEDPAAFLQNHPAPVMIDEIQYAPELFPYIKMAVDKARTPGMFWLTSSQQFHLMKNVSESLAGRIAILNLLGLSLAEERGFAENALPFLPTQDSLTLRAKTAETLLLPAIYHKIWRGSFPFVVPHDDTITWETFYSSYVQTYLQRDVRDFTRVGDEQLFLRFLQTSAARTSQLINYTDMARDIGISEPTVKSWLSILEASGLIYMLAPYHSNQTKRLLKAPKLYFLDTGLCSYLTGWHNPEVLEKGAMNGAIFETFITSELIKTYWHNGRSAPFFFYRDRDKREIDLVIVENGTLYPVEIKKTATPDKDMVKHFTALDRLKMPVGQGAIICAREIYGPITRDIFSVPVGYI